MSPIYTPTTHIHIDRYNMKGSDLALQAAITQNCVLDYGRIKTRTKRKLKSTNKRAYSANGSSSDDIYGVQVGEILLTHKLEGQRFNTSGTAGLLPVVSSLNDIKVPKDRKTQEFVEENYLFSGIGSTPQEFITNLTKSNQAHRTGVAAIVGGKLSIPHVGHNTIKYGSFVRWAAPYDKTNDVIKEAFVEDGKCPDKKIAVTEPFDETDSVIMQIAALNPGLAKKLLIRMRSIIGVAQSTAEPGQRLDLLLGRQMN